MWNQESQKSHSKHFKTPKSITEAGNNNNKTSNEAGKSPLHSHQLNSNEEPEPQKSAPNHPNPPKNQPQEPKTTPKINRKTSGKRIHAQKPLKFVTEKEKLQDLRQISEKDLTFPPREIFSMSTETESLESISRGLRWMGTETFARAFALLLSLPLSLSCFSFSGLEKFSFNCLAFKYEAIVARGIMGISTRVNSTDALSPRFVPTVGGWNYLKCPSHVRKQNPGEKQNNYRGGVDGLLAISVKEVFFMFMFWLAWWTCQI